MTAQNWKLLFSFYCSFLKQRSLFCYSDLSRIPRTHRNLANLRRFHPTRDVARSSQCLSGKPFEMYCRNPVLPTRYTRNARRPRDTRDVRPRDAQRRKYLEAILFLFLSIKPDERESLCGAKRTAVIIVSERSVHRFEAFLPIRKKSLG